MEHLRSIKITIEVDTNKETIKEELVFQEDEKIKEFYRRIMNKIREIICTIK